MALFLTWKRNPRFLLQILCSESINFLILSSSSLSLFVISRQLHPLSRSTKQPSVLIMPSIYAILPDHILKKSLCPLGLIKVKLVRGTGFEPAQDRSQQPLKLSCLPIPPPAPNFALQNLILK